MGADSAIAQERARLTYDSKDRTHRQISPKAFALLVKNGAEIPTGARDDKSPNFRGLDDAFWQRLHDKNLPDFVKIVSIARQDFPTFCAVFLRIVSRLDMMRTPFIWNSGQNAVWNKMVWCVQNERMIALIILKARQMGITCFVAAWHFWQLWRGDHVRTLDTTHDEALATRVISFFRVFYEGMPTVKDHNGDIVRILRPPLRSESKTAKIPKKELYFSDRMCQGDTYVAKNLDPRGFTSPHIGLHEAAFYPNLNDFVSALEPQLPALGTKARLKCSFIYESTPNAQNDFYDTWENAKDPDSELVCVFLPWYIHDDEYTLDPPKGWRLDEDEVALKEKLSLQRRKIDGKLVTRAQMYWRYKKILELKGDEDAFDMEYPSDDQSCFMMKSQSVFSDDMKFLTQSVLAADLRAQKAWAQKTDISGEPIETKGPVCGKLAFKPLHSPFETKFHIKIERPKFVLGEGGNLWVWEPPLKGHVYVAAADTAGGELGRDLSTCFVMDLMTGCQVAEYAGTISPMDFADDLVHLSRWYNDCMMMPEINGLGSVVLKRMSNEWGFVNFAHEEKWDEVGVKKNKPGFNTSPLNRPMIFSTLQWFVAERYIQVSSRDLVREMSTFKKDGMDYRTAKKHQHDDRVVAAGLCCIAVRQAPKLFAQVEAARRERLPTAVDLGLSHSPDITDAREQHLKNKADDDTIDRIFGRDIIDLPWNAIRGPFDIGD